MYVCGKSLASIAVFAFVLGWGAPAWADPVRITVAFNVIGAGTPSASSSSGPRSSRATASGSFSIVAEAPAGGGKLENFKRGLSADTIAFTWAGTSWTRATADVPRLVFDARGSLVYWQLAGFPNGLIDISAKSTPDLYVDPFAFLYTAPGGGSRLLEGGVLSTTVRITAGPRVVQNPGPDPGPVPEPMSLALVASGLLGLSMMRRLRPA
jgi:hypothetical protein